MEFIPKTGIKGLIENWQADMIAAISVSLIALPLSLGIALAAGAPAMAGILSAIVGGIVTTLYRGGHVSVNGPAKGVIAVILFGITVMDDGSGQAFNYVRCNRSSFWNIKIRSLSRYLSFFCYPWSFSCYWNHHFC